MGVESAASEFVDVDKEASDEVKCLECRTNGRPQDTKLTTCEEDVRAAACRRPQLGDNLLIIKTTKI